MRCLALAACSALGASSTPRVCSTQGKEGARLHSAWHSTRGVFAVSRVLRSRRYPPCRQRSQPVLGLMDAVCWASSCAPCPRCALPLGATTGLDPSPGSWDVELASALPSGLLPIPTPPLQTRSSCGISTSHRGAGAAQVLAPRPFTRQPGGGQAGCPCRTRGCWGRGIKVEVLITQMSGKGERWFPW